MAGGGLFFSGSGVPLKRAEDIIPLLARRYHWREGRSAFESAHSWFDANDVPPAIRAALMTDPEFQEARLVKVCFERQTELDRYGRASQTDVLAFLSTDSGPVVVGVEAKVDENLGETVAGWTAKGAVGREKRLAGLIRRLEIDPSAVAPLRYQLLHRTVATLMEAEIAAARSAVLVVHSFSPRSLRVGFDDFQAFSAVLGAAVEEPGVLSQSIWRGGIQLRLGWVQDQIRSVRVGQ